MSTNEQHSGDRRVRRTRLAIIDAVTTLLFSSGVAAVTMANVAETANVGRSTLYDHFKNKEELLAASIAPLFGGLANECVAETESPELIALITHFWNGRAFAPTMLAGRAGAQLERILASSFEDALMIPPQPMLDQARPRELRLAAVYMATGTIGILRDWLTGKVAGSSVEIAALLRRFGEPYRHDGVRIGDDASQRIEA